MQTAAVAETLLEVLIRFYRPQAPRPEATTGSALAARRLPALDTPRKRGAGQPFLS